MSEQWIEVEADSLEEARELLKSQVPEGLYLISEQVISDGSVQTIKAYADSVEAAFAKACSEVPEGAEIVKETKLADPKREGFTVEAADEESARSVATSQASSRFGKEATVENLRLVAEGKKGFLGVGRKPNQYEVEVVRQAAVEITYKTKAKVSAKVGVNIQALISDLKSNDENVRQASIKALVKAGTIAIKPLNAVLEDVYRRTPVEHIAAAEILWQLGETKAIQSLVEVGLAFASSNFLTRAIQYFEAAVRINPDDVEAHTSLGVAYMSNSNLDEAVGEFQRALQIDPSDALAHFNLGIAYRNQHRFDEAICEFKATLDINPKDADTQTELGITYGIQGQHEKAASELKKAVQMGSGKARQLLSQLGHL